MFVPFTSAMTNYYTNTTETNKELTSTNYVLTLTHNGEHKYYSLVDLLSFDSITGNGGRINSIGEILSPYEYTGVLITTLAQAFASMPSQYSVIAKADDGYTNHYIYDEILGNVMVYDNDGSEIGVGGVTMILATMENGQTGYDGSYRIAFINQDEPGPITFSALWAKYVVELEFIEELSDATPPTISIVKPSNALYLFDKQLLFFSQPFIIGEITINVNAYDASGISKVLIRIDGDLKQEITSSPYRWLWDETVIGTSTIEAIAYDNVGNFARAEKNVLIINP